MRTIYRIEHKDTGNGMWYNMDGTYNGFIKNLTEGKSKDVPMGKHQKCPVEHGKWHSGVKSLGQLLEWFSEKDIDELFASGYKLFEFQCEEYYEAENEIYFTREGVVSRKIY